jgi:ion channel POLLUX/CASTOR
MITIGYLVNPEKGFLEYFWIGFNQTLDPGNLLGEEGSFIYMLIMTMSTLMGIFVMSLFISFILNGFQKKLLDLSNGKSDVIEKNHTLILGWNDGIFVIINELILANMNQKNPRVVILADLKPIEMLEKIRIFVPDNKNTKLIFRNGDIANENDLNMCAINAAKSVIVLGNDFEITRSLIGISATDFYNVQNSHISAVFENIKNMNVCRNIAKGKLEPLYFTDFIKRIIAQTSLQPGLSVIFNDLFDFDGDEIYFYTDESLTGKNFLEIQKGFKKSIAIGIKRDDNIIMHPQNSEVILENDSIIVISEDDDTANFNLYSEKVNQTLIKDTKRISNLKECKMLLIGFNDDTLGVLDELDNYILNGSTCTIIVLDESTKKQIEMFQSKLRNIKLNVIVGDTTSRDFLQKFVDGSLKSILIFGNKSTLKNDRDSESLLSLLHLRDIEQDFGLSLNIVVEVNELRNARIVDLVKVDDFVISEMTSNKLLTQISENRKLSEIFNYLLSDEGSEIYLKPISEYIHVNHEVTFYDLIDACNLKGEIPLGYKKKLLPENNGIVLNPLKSKKVKFDNDDLIIVLSED